MNLLDQWFDLSAPDALVFGRGTAAAVGPRVAGWGERALLVTDPGVREAGLTVTVADSLRGAGWTVERFDGINADPSIATATACATAARDAGADVVVGVGGGSVMDVAKVAALAVGAAATVEELVDVDGSFEPGLPTVLLPTTSGTGSEVSPAAVLRDGRGEKVGVIDPALYADLAVVDPELSMRLPANLTAATGIDAFSHAVGSTISTDSNELADALCGRAMELVATHLRAATFRGADAPEARVGMAAAATLGMLGRVNGGKAAIHSVAYGVQAMYDVPHGVAIALVLPTVLDYNAPAAVDTYASLGTGLFDATGDRRSRAADFVDGVTLLRDDLGLPASLREVGGAEGDLDELADLAVRSERHLEANPRALSAAAARELLADLL